MIVGRNAEVPSASRRQQNDHGVGGRFLQGLEQGVLGGGGHFFRVLQNVDLAGGAVGLDLDVGPHFADIVDADAVLLLTLRRDQVRIVIRRGLDAGEALSAGLNASVHSLRIVAEQSSRKAPGDHMPPGALCSVENVCMRDLAGPQSVLKVRDNNVLTYDF